MRSNTGGFRIGRRMRLAEMYVKLYPGSRPCDVARACGSSLANGYRTVKACISAGLIHREHIEGRISLTIRQGRGIQ